MRKDLHGRASTMFGRGRVAAVSISYSLGILFRYAPLPGSLLLGQSAVSGTAAPLSVWAMTRLIDELSKRASVPWRAVMPWLMVLAAAFVIRSVDNSARIYLSSLTRERILSALHQIVFEHACSLPLAAFEHSQYYQKLETGRWAIHDDVVEVVMSAATLVSAIVAGAGLLVLFAEAHWLLAAVLVGTAILRSFAGARLTRWHDQVNYEKSPLKRELSYWGKILSSREAAPEVRLFGLVEPLLARRRRVFERYLAGITALRKRMAWQTLASQAFQEVVGWVAVLFLLLLALRQVVSVGTLVGLLYGLSRFRTLTSTVSSATAFLVMYWGFLEHLRDFLSLAPEPHSVRCAVPPRPIGQGVRFDRVGFTYPGSDRPALSDVSLVLRPGEHVALIGENGAGKTTLVKLLLGLYHPTDGKITVDGIDLADINPDEWRRDATAVFQDFMHYPGTVCENIAYADASLLADGPGVCEDPHPRIMGAAARSGADEFINTLPARYATPLGKEWEGGVEISAGQWQRLALARAYLRDAQILVLDEPTAALDPRAEVEVYHEFSEAAAGKCAVLISHRLGSARLADRIVVLREGRVVEDGDHDSLLRLGGEYAQLYRLQAGWYVDKKPIASESALSVGD